MFPFVRSVWSAASYGRGCLFLVGPPGHHRRRNPERPRAFRRLDRAAIARLLPYPIANYYVVLSDSSESRVPALGAAPASNVPPRVQPAALDEGPHRNYAVQWFSFAAISIIGLVILLRRV